MNGLVVARLGYHPLLEPNACRLDGDLPSFGKVEVHFEPPPPHSRFERLFGWLWVMSDDPITELAEEGFIRGVAESPEGGMMGVEFGRDEARLPPRLPPRTPADVNVFDLFRYPQCLLSDSPGGVQLMGTSGETVAYLLRSEFGSLIPVAKTAVGVDDRLARLSPGEGDRYEPDAEWSVVAELLVGGRWLVSGMRKIESLSLGDWVWLHQRVVGVFDPDVTVGEVLEAYRAQGPSSVSG